MMDPQGLNVVKAIVLAGAGYFFVRTAVIAVWFAAIHLNAIG
jgi:hypothetical protein